MSSSIPYSSIPPTHIALNLKISGQRLRPELPPARVLSSLPSNGPQPIDIHYPPVHTQTPSPADYRPWRPSSAGQRAPHEQYDPDQPAPFLKAHSGHLARPTKDALRHWEEMEEQKEPDGQTPAAKSPKRSRSKRSGTGSRSTSTTPTRSRSVSQSQSRTHSLSPTFDGEKHRFLRAHSGGHAHPDVGRVHGQVAQEHDLEHPNEYADHHKVNQSNPRHGDDLELHLVNDLLDAEEEEARSSAQSIALAPIPPTRYPFHYDPPSTISSHPPPPNPPSRPAAAAAAPSSSISPLGPPGTLAAYIQRFRTQPPKPSTARTPLPQLWWQTSESKSNQPPAAAPPPIYGSHQNSSAQPMSTSDHLRAMEQQVESQHIEQQRRRQENVARLTHELNNETGIDEQLPNNPSSFTAVADDFNHSQAELDDSLLGDFSMLDGLEPSALHASRPIESVPTHSYRITATSTHSRQPKQSILDDSDDFSGLSGPTTTNQLVTSSQPPIRSHNQSETDVDELLNRLRQTRQRSQAPQPSSHRPHGYSSPSPTRRMTTDVDSPEVDQFIHRLKKRLGLEEAVNGKKSVHPYSTEPTNNSFSNPPSTLSDSFRPIRIAGNVRTTKSPRFNRSKAVDEDYSQTNTNLSDAFKSTEPQATSQAPSESKEQASLVNEIAPSSAATSSTPSLPPTEPVPSERSAEKDESKHESSLPTASTSAIPAYHPPSSASASLLTADVLALEHAKTIARHLLRDELRGSQRRSKKEKRKEKPPKISIHITTTAATAATANTTQSQPISLAATMQPITDQATLSLLPSIDESKASNEPHAQTSREVSSSSSSIPAAAHFASNNQPQMSYYSLPGSPDRNIAHQTSRTAASTPGMLDSSHHSSQPSVATSSMQQFLPTTTHHASQLMDDPTSVASEASHTNWTTSSPPRRQQQLLRPSNEPSPALQIAATTTSSVVSSPFTQPTQLVGSTSIPPNQPFLVVPSTTNVNLFLPPLPPPPADLARLCGELGMTVSEYYADAQLQLLVHQLARLQTQQAQINQMNQPPSTTKA